MKEQTNYNKLVARKDDLYYFCDYIFSDGATFRGATATVLRPIPNDEYKERTDRDSLIDSLEEAWKDAVQSGCTTWGLEAWADEAINIDGEEHCAGMDPSGEHLYPQMRALGLSEEDYPAIECMGGGRSFSHDDEFDEIYDPELWAKIQEVERPVVTA